jgi:hypothetical protein
LGAPLINPCQFERRVAFSRKGEKAFLRALQASTVPRLSDATASLLHRLTEAIFENLFGVCSERRSDEQSDIREQTCGKSAPAPLIAAKAGIQGWCKALGRRLRGDERKLVLLRSPPVAERV